MYIATNEGLYEYRHGRMNEIKPAKEQRGASLFDLVENSKHEVFCINLIGQIFKISNDRLELVIQIPIELYNERVVLAVDDADRLVVCSEGCFLVENGRTKLILKSVNDRSLSLNKMISGEIILAVVGTDSIYTIQNGQIIQSKSDILNLEKSGGYNILELNNKKLSTFFFNSIYDDKLNYQVTDRHQYTQINEKEVWARSSIRGIKVVTADEENNYSSKEYFSNTFISSISVDKEGVIFLGTFGKGLLVIPNIFSKSYGSIIKGNNLQHIAHDDHYIFTSDIIEGLLVYNKATQKVESYPNLSSDKIFILKDSKLQMDTRYPQLLTSDFQQISDIKGIHELDSTTILMAATHGLLKYGPSPLFGDKYWKLEKSLNEKNICYSKIFNKRSIAVTYDKYSKSIYVSTLSSLTKMDSDGTLKEIKFNNLPIIANDLLFEDGLLWCATQNHGILILKNDEVVQEINTKNGLGNNYVTKFEKEINTLYISHNDGFQIYDLINKEWSRIGRSEGIENGTIKDFCIDEDKIWFISNDQIQSFDIRINKSRNPEMILSIDSLRIDQKNTSLSEHGQFNHHENNLEFFIDYRGLICESEVELQYLLLDIDNNSLYQKSKYSISDEVIEFKNLPPGSYDFKLMANHRGKITETPTYTFRIYPAFWKTAWFYVLCTSVIILMLTIFFTSRYRRQEKANLEKLEKQTLKTEAVEAELKALRAQMNPHFIFNSINSIQDLILKEDTEASYDYLVLFSELVRNALNYSNKNVIELDNEISFIEAYLKLEKLRFGSEFTYTIENKTNRNLFVPSLVIQPFVENAVEHGVFHLKGEKRISISFNIEENELHCTIIDNGVGRKFSQKLNSKSSRKHQSFALDAIFKRLQILNNKHEGNIGYEIFDLENEGKISGTKVLVRFPIIEREPEPELHY